MAIRCKCAGGVALLMMSAREFEFIDGDEWYQPPGNLLLLQLLLRVRDYGSEDPRRERIL